MNGRQGSTLTHLNLNKMDPQWALQEAERMMAFHPVSERANASGKFYRNYQCWHFHKNSSWPLIKEFAQQLEFSREAFTQNFTKPMNYEFVILSLVDGGGLEVCNFHRDGYFFDGQLHLTILGQANIEVLHDDNLTELLRPQDGTIWYLNGSQYYHRVVPPLTRRIELCAPLNQLPKDVEIKMRAVRKEDGKMWVDGNNQDWIDLRKQQINYVKEAVQRRTASNLNIAEFCLDETND
jgi:hypothetical protein